MTVIKDAPIKCTKLRSGLLFGLLTSDKYLLDETFSVYTNIRGFEYDDEALGLEANGRLEIRKGFLWDGASGPTIDTKGTLRASCVHDALYSLFSFEVIPPHLRYKADLCLLAFLIHDGNNRWRAYSWTIAVMEFGAKHIKLER